MRTDRAEKTDNRLWTVLAVILLVACGTSSADAPGPADPVLPAQEAYKDWPPAELRERPWWVAWDDAPFSRAALFSRPVLLVLTVNSNRRSTRWLADTFADPEVLRLVNAAYISVLVNADLRPDIGERYRTGAWPTIALLTPNGHPLLARIDRKDGRQPITTSSVDREALLSLLREGSVSWSRRRDELLAAGAAWARDEGARPPTRGAPGARASDTYAEWLLERADREDGGFGTGPRFVVPAMAELAWHRASRDSLDLSRHIRLQTERMLAGGLHDADRGGVYRLAASPGYGGVRPEKPLEVNVAWMRQLIVGVREDPASASLRDALARSARFVTQELGRPGGGFFSSSTDGDVDRLVLSGPNAAAGAALLQAAAVLRDSDVARRGEAALELVLASFWADARGERHAIEPPDGSRYFLIAQADTALGFVEAYESTGRRRYLDAARQIADEALRRLADAGAPALRDTDTGGDERTVGLLRHERRPMRPNARMARALIRIGRHVTDDRYADAALSILSAYAGDVASYGVHGAELALAIEEQIATPVVVTIHGASDDPLTAELRRAATTANWPAVTIREGDRSRGAAAAELSIGSGAGVVLVESSKALTGAIRAVGTGGGDTS